MKYLFAGLLATIFFISGAYAQTRPVIAESAELVTPLLNGQRVNNVTLKTAQGDPVSLQALLMQKPTIVLFYRGGWCPYCNRQLAGLKEVESKLVDLGYQLLAVSPESSARLQEQKLETEFLVTLISDDSLNAIKAFGVGYYMPEALAGKYESKMNITLTKDEETGKAVLPAPAVFILDKKGIVKFSYVNPDYKQRISPELLYQAAKLSL